jgi:hypothetical protein
MVAANAKLGRFTGFLLLTPAAVLADFPPFSRTFAFSPSRTGGEGNPKRRERDASAGEQLVERAAAED